MGASATPSTFLGLRDTLRTRLALFSALMIVAFASVLSIGVQRKFEDDRAAAAERLHAHRVSVERLLTTYVETLRTKMATLEDLARFDDLQSPELTLRCKQFLRLHPELINVAVVDRDATLRFSTAFPITNPPQNYRALPNSEEIFQPATFHITTAAKGTTTGLWGCVAVQPLKANPNLLLTVPIDLQKLAKLTYLAPDSTGLIVSVADRNKRLVLTSHDPATNIGALRPAGSHLREELAAGRNTGSFVGVDGTLRIYDAALIPSADWLVSAAVPYDEIYADAWRKLLRGLMLIIFVVVLSIVAVNVFSAALVRPVIALASAAREHAAGRRDTLAAVDGPFEIAETAQAFNDMVLARRRAEDELLASERRYRTVVDQTGQLIYDIDIPSGRILWFGERAIVEITGHTPEEFAQIDGQAWSTRLHPDDHAAVLERYDRCLTTGEPFVAEYRFRHKDGSYRIIEDFGVIVPSATGQPVRMLGRMGDITTRRATEAALREGEDRYRLVAEQTGQLIYDLDVKTGQAQWFGGDAARQILGTTPEEFSALGVDGWRARLHPEDRDAAIARLDYCLRHGTPCVAEYRLRHSDGTYHRVDERGAVLLDARGAVYRMVGRMIDITERAKALQEITTQQRLLREIIDLVPHFIFAKDRAGRFLLANASVARAHGLTPKQMLGRSDAEINGHPEEVAAFRSADESIFIDGQPLVVPEEYFTDHQGQRRALSTVKIPFLFPGPHGDIPALLGVAVDITELKQAHAARDQIEKKLLETQKLESLGVLAGGIAHDFNNLLTGVLGNASLARLALPPGSTIAENIQQIERAAHRAADLCKQMLAYSGRGRFVVQSLDLDELVRDTLELLTVSVSKKAQLHFQPAGQLPPIQADAAQLRQIVMNLVINASEALEERNGQIAITTGRATIDPAFLATAQLSGELALGEAVLLEVRDNGCGMPPETLARIFDPFFTTKFTGRGLGLAAVLGIVRGHKGAIQVKSEIGLGTTFRIYLPSTTGRIQPLRRSPAHAPVHPGNGHILVVDDEETVREVAASVLQALGFTAETAADGAIAIERFRADPERFDVVLLDLTMPNVDGEETFHQMRLIRPDVKVVLMSGFNRADAVGRFIGKGLAGFVQKPFQVETLSAELQRVLARPKKTT